MCKGVVSLAKFLQHWRDQLERICKTCMGKSFALKSNSQSHEFLLKCDPTLRPYLSETQD